MELPVLVLPQPNGFRASTGEPFNLSAEGPTPDTAIGALRSAIVAKLQTGQIRTIILPESEITSTAA